MRLSHHRFWAILSAYAKSQGGQMGIIMGVTLTAILIAAGAAYDYSQLSNAQNRSQEIADSVALRAAIYVSNHGSVPTSNTQGLQHNTVYSADQLGYDYHEPVNGGTSSVSIKVIYDDAEKEARAVVWGGTKPSFMQMAGFGQLDFQARSRAKYAEADIKDPASIFLVMDNSGSMAWDDRKVNPDWTDQAGAQARIAGLKTSVQGFMTELDNIVGSQTTVGHRVLRTGMLAYNTGTISNRTVLPMWGPLTNGNINAMSAGGGTNSAPSMSTAASWMTAEPAIHNGETGKAPLRFVIFMTDGVNTSGGSQWEADNTTNYWRKWTCNRRGCRWRHRNRANSPGAGWEEGHYVSVANSSTLASCSAMKTAGVTIYTIGYALEPGHYFENRIRNGNRQYEYTSQSTTDTAYGLLQGCASKPENFIAAENATDLEAAFQTIGADIALEIIRIAS